MAVDPIFSTSATSQMAPLPLSKSCGSLIWSEGSWESNSMPDDYQRSGSLLQDPEHTKQASVQADLLAPFFSSLYAQSDVTDRLNSVQEPSLQPLNLEDCSNPNCVLQETTLQSLPRGLNCDGITAVSSINNLCSRGSLQLDSPNLWYSCTPKIENIVCTSTETKYLPCCQRQTDCSLADEAINERTTRSEDQTNVCCNNVLISPIIITENPCKATMCTAPVNWGANFQDLAPASRIEPAIRFTKYDHILDRKNCSSLVVTRSNNANQKVECKLNSFEEVRTTGDPLLDDEDAAKRLLHKRRCSISQENSAFRSPEKKAVSSEYKGVSTTVNGSMAQTSDATRLALNRNGKPRAKRGSATDPQSIYARQRRERINERLKILQNLVPNGAKVDIVTMLEEAINYVKFLKLQVKLLSSDEYWMYAPTTYNGINVCFDMSVPTQASVANSP